MIKKILLGIILLGITSVYAKDTVLVGQTEITIPQVEGFQSVGQNHVMYEVTQSFIPPTNELLDIKITNSDIDAEIRGMEPKYNRYIIMQTYIPTKNRSINSNQFEQLRSILDTEYEERTAAVQSKIDEMAEKGSKKISDKYSIDMATKITNNVPLEIFYNQGQRFSAMNLMAGSVAVDGYTESVNMIMGLNVLHVKGKVIYMYVYEETDSQSARDWVKKMSTEFSEALIKQ